MLSAEHSLELTTNSMKLPTLTSILSGFFTFSLCWTSVLSRHTPYTCEGGRATGDKWFDGCRWCVCQVGGPLCSSANCSDLVSQVPPCENIGSRWRDGCYQCKCHLHGIECVADSSCVILMQRPEYQRQILSPGACVEPEDDRCVCGVDGVPSCTAEVIDRNAHPATTIALDSSFSSSRRPERRKAANYDVRQHRFGRRRVKRRALPPGHFARRYQDNGYRYRNNHKRLPGSSYHRVYNSLGGYYSYTKVRHGYPNKGILINQMLNSRKRHNSLNKKQKRPFWNEDHDDRRRKMDKSDFDYNGDILNDKSRDLQTTGFFLISTSNRCRYGVRWYGGGLRCYCNDDSSITCGDPKFVATRIDGFRMKRAPCEEAHVWHDENSCQVCDCKISGVVLCQRSESCPLPFLIKPVPEEDEVDDSRDSRENNDQSSRPSFKRTGDRRSGFPNFNRFYPNRSPYEETKHSYGSGGSGDAKTIDLPYRNIGKPPRILDISHIYNKIHNKINKPSSQRYTTVEVTECNPGSKWRDGCKKCSCDSKGRKHCNSERCLKPATPAFRPIQLMSGINVEHGRPFQRPPVIPIIRDRPVQLKLPFPREKTCGRFKVNERYYVKCNRCLCTPHGPKCTAVSCG